MKNLLLFSSIILCLFTTANAQIIDFPDPNFKAALLEITYNDNGTWYSLDRNNDGQIEPQEASYIKRINLNLKNLTSVKGIENFINLEELSLFSNNIQEIDISNNKLLQKFNIGKNPITNLNVSKNINLKELVISITQISSIDITKNVKLEELAAHEANLSAIDLSKNILLKNLSLFDNNFSQIDVSNNSKLESLFLSDNTITELDVSQNPELKTLYIRNNRLTNINITNNAKLELLNIGINQITELNINNNTLLELISAGQNQISTINVTNNKELVYLYLNNNKLSTIDLSENTKIQYLHLNSNLLETIDVRKCRLLNFHFDSNRNLKKVYMTGQPFQFRANGEINIRLYNNRQNLEFICADQQYLSAIYELLKEANQTDVLLSNDCDTPHNRISGNVTYDNESDGCDNQDVPFTESVSFSLAGPAGFYTVFPDKEGEYTFHVPDGNNYLMFNNIANSTYFTFFPTIIFDPINDAFNIPEQIDSITTDFCIQPVGVFNDLEISIIPLTRARPGFSATYKVTYKNIGTTTQSGEVTLAYQNDVLTYTTASPTIDSNTNGLLTWSFTNLAPMQSKEIIVTYRLNTPTDSPALNNGDILNYTAKVTASPDEETPENNIAKLTQTVVNSYDPNDKTCLEGVILDPDDVGEYLHYLIRFENKGTAEAVNIRVQDDIDTTKLDIKSFIPLNSSHLFTTTVTNNKVVNFHFNNINLPFDDASNDGYVLFKIKSKNNLVEGDQIVNGAGIYFDFNPPVITEDEIVTVKREVIDVPTFSDYFSLTPNPTTGIINLKLLDTSVKPNTIILYDINGNIVGFFPGIMRLMNISYLFPNTYFMKIQTNKGEFTTQVIKL